MNSFQLFLENTVQITGFKVCGYPDTTSVGSFSEAMKEAMKKKRAIFARFSDNTSRLIFYSFDTSTWFLNQNGRTVYDNTTKDKTLQGYLAKDDPKYLTLVAINYFKWKLTSHHIENLPSEFWKYVDSALQEAIDTVSLQSIWELYDWIQEQDNLDQKDVKFMLATLKYGLSKAGINI